MRLKPLHDWAVIVPSEAEIRTSGGIFIPDTAKEKPAEGVVEAIGPGAYEEEKFGKKKKEQKEQKERKFIPTTVKPGDRVLYAAYAGQKVTIGNEERVLVRERDILGVLPPKPVEPKAELPPLQIPQVMSSARETTVVKKKGQGKAKEKAAKKKGQLSSSKGQGKATKKPLKKAKKKR